MEDSRRKYRCCFTGHRPEKLNMAESEVKKRLEEAIDMAISDGYTTFLSGMARGVDMWAAEIVIKKKEECANLKLVCVPPFKGFEKSWRIEERERFLNIISKADFVRYTSENYSRASFQIRNCYMVNNSKRVIAAYNGQKGGTRNTIEYAEQNNVEIVNIFKNQER